MTAPTRERRRAARAHADFPIQLHPTGGATSARLKDLSAIGLCCTSTVKVPEMTLLGIDLQLPGEGRRHTLQGAVVRCAAVPAQKGTYELAVFFTQIGEDTKAALGGYVERGRPA